MDMEEIKKRIAIIETVEQNIQVEMSSLSKSVHELALNVERQTQILAGQKDFWNYQISALGKEMQDVKSNVRANHENIDRLNARFHEINGASKAAKWIIGVVWALIGFVVAYVIPFFASLFKGGG